MMLVVEKLVVEFEEDKEDLLVLHIVNGNQSKHSDIKNVIIRLIQEVRSGNGCAVLPFVGFCVGKGVGILVGGDVGRGVGGRVGGSVGGGTSTHANVISFRILKKFSARSGPPSSAPVPQGGL